MDDKKDEAKIAQIPVYLHDLATKGREGGAWAIIFRTVENIPGELINYYATRRNQLGWLTFMSKEIAVDDVIDLPDLDEMEYGKKSLSQRLRAVIYLYWKANHKKESFQNYYARVMEKIIDEWKEKLDG